VKLDPGAHVFMHSGSPLNPGVTGLAPMNLTATLLLFFFINKKWLSLYMDLKLLGKVGKGRVGVGHSLV
jgi:hypothetical protein